MWQPLWDTKERDRSFRPNSGRQSIGREATVGGPNKEELAACKNWGADRQATFTALYRFKRKAFWHASVSICQIFSAPERAVCLGGLLVSTLIVVKSKSDDI